MFIVPQSFLADQSAATSIEYALIAAGVAIAIVVVIARTGGALNKVFVTLSAAL
jgi:pilus assembly protein Flp/PilA